MYFEEMEYGKRLDLNVIKRLAVFAEPYKVNIIILMVQMFFLALVDALFPKLSQYVIDNFAVKKSLDGFWLLCLVAVGLVVFQAANMWLMIRNAGRIEHYIPYDMRKTVFRKLQELPISYYDRTPVGWIMSRVTSDIRRIGVSLSWHVVDLFWSTFLIIIMTIFMLATNPSYALMVLCVVPALAILSMVFQKKILFNYRKARKYNSQITAAFNEGITGAKTVKSLGIEEYMLNEFEKTTGQMKDFSVRAATVSSIYMPLIILFGSIATGLVLWKGGIE